MSKGNSSRFNGTRGNPQLVLRLDHTMDGGGYSAGDVSYMDSKDRFAIFIRHRSDIDAGGAFDVVAHGSPMLIEVMHNGSSVLVNHRVAARLIRNSKDCYRQSIRLLSCCTGALDEGFAQNLANKMGVPVIAPSSILWAWSSGKYLIADDDGTGKPDPFKKGSFRTFYPKRRGK